MSPPHSEAPQGEFGRDAWSSRLLRPDIASMEPYAPIVPFDVLSQRLGRPAAEITKLDANENPYGPSPAALEALRDLPWIHIYPDPESTRLRQALGEFLDLPPGRLLVGMGADEVIDLILRAVLARGDSVLTCPPTFGMYAFSTAVNMGRLLTVPRRDDFLLDLASIAACTLQAEKLKVIFICSPNNPDGSVIADHELRALLELPALVVLDEAYIEFAEPGGERSRVRWVLRHDNLIVLRTFSKWAGLAGLRVGYGAFPEWLLPHLWKIKQPYNVNTAASAAALASLREPQWMVERLRLIVAERERMVAFLRQFDFLRPYPSKANFVLFRVLDRPAAQLKADLAAQGVLVRYFDKPGLQNCIRISAGRPQDTDRLAAALQTLA